MRWPSSTNTYLSECLLYHPPCGTKWQCPKFWQVSVEHCHCRLLMSSAFQDTQEGRLLLTHLQDRRKLRLHLLPVSLFLPQNRQKPTRAVTWACVCLQAHHHKDNRKNKQVCFREGLSAMQKENLRACK